MNAPASPVPPDVAKALLVWFEAPHALVIEDACGLHDWFHVDFALITYGIERDKLPVSLGIGHV